ncbi:MAG: sugar kinase, partial [Planctomycetes bacterium]|nr:sugar kinase [Planctomycetota bacterium]
MTDPVVIGVGTVAYDTIGTPHHKKKTVLGGSATYFAISASYFNTVGIVSVVGTDFSDESLSQLKKRKIDLNGLMSLSGKTFHWEGEYDSNLIDRKTLRTDLNVYADFNPILPEEYKDARFALLGNGTPENQMAVFTQLNSPELVLLDTMNYWINHHRSALEEVISTVKALS